MVNTTTVIVCILLIIVEALKEGVQCRISANVSVTTSEPTEGFCVAFTCDFSYNAVDTLAVVDWRFGPRLSGSTKIVRWIYNNHDNATYGPGYSAPRHQMSIADIYSGQTVLSIDPVQLSDEGRYWCEVSVFGDIGNAYADIQVKDAQPFQVVVTVEGGTNEVVYGSPVTLICEYTYDDTDDTVQSIGWAIGKMEGDLTPIAAYIPPLKPPISYRGKSYQPPAYEMTVDEGDGRGRSDFMIQSVDWVDGDGPFWCTVAFNSALHGTKPVFLSVTGLLGKSTTTPASQSSTPSRSLENTTYEYKTTDIIGYLEVIRVEYSSIEIGWESFQTDVDDVDKYRVFYTAISSKSQNDNNAIFVDGNQPGVNITSLTPDTIYSVLVEASTTQGILITVGSIEVTTTSSDMDGFPLPIVISVTVAVAVAVIVGVILVCSLRSRRTSKTPALTKTIQPVYDDVAADNGVYEDLQPVTGQIRRTNQRPTENTTKNSGQQIVYEVSPSGTGYDEIPNKRQKQPEYLDIYNTAPQVDGENVKVKRAPYMSLDKNTMEKSNIKYEISDPKPEYFQLLTTTTVDDQYIAVSQGPDAGTYEIPVPEYLEFDSSSPAAENTNLVSDPGTYEIPGPEYLEFDNPTPALEASLKKNPEYMALDQKTMDKAATYQSIVTDESHENISTI